MQILAPFLCSYAMYGGKLTPEKVVRLTDQLAQILDEADYMKEREVSPPGVCRLPGIAFDNSGFGIFTWVNIQVD